MPEIEAPPPEETLARMAALLLHGEIEVVDCSGVLGPDTPVEAGPAVEIHKISEYDKDGPFFAWNWLKVAEQAGTHFEAPSAWISGRETPGGGTDTLDTNRLTAPACVIDCAEDCEQNPGFLLTEARLHSWEEVHGEIPARSWVLMRSDWDKRDFAAAAAVAPGPAPDAMRYLVAKGVTGWGTQCLTPDCSDAERLDPPWPARHLLAEAGRFCLAGLTCLDRLPPTGALLTATPLKFVGGHASPARVLALVPRGNRPS